MQVLCRIKGRHDSGSDDAGDCYEQLLFFFSSSSDMRLPYAFHFTYLYMSLPAGVHELPNTCTTCVCLMVNIPFPPV
jgi:hypothetical protein